MSAWTSASGPQYFQDYPGPIGTTLYIYEYPYYSDPGGVLGGPSILAVTWNRAYPSNAICGSLSAPCLEWYGTLFVNNTNNQFAGFTDAKRQAVIAHELGHVVLLAHHPSTSALMYSYVNPAINAPTSLDIGSNPACNEDPSGGSPTLVTVFCIYNW